ncbi:NAD(P)-dependent oxidoreductase [Aliiroseovarius subalbicans]|uniref:NAD(P)-dependent oxidoreductase n=1 Tax=Aliiroseovarius subalbicans TaxID=2925840 RepID=UPI001F56B329|nr:NAD(P)-dependent oxidoreductase [Aliiroseovarius subalbicans]MCI2399218.1 DUF1932 domain-containing protein [Aliiroseovarius subalbicans]
MTKSHTPIGLIGFGEAAAAFVSGWRHDAPTLALSAFDIKTTDPTQAAAKQAEYASAGVTGLSRPEFDCTAILSLVTADQAHQAACAAAETLHPGTLFLDGNSCAPDTKRASSAVIEAAGGRYVDLAIMAPVHPALNKVPLLLSGANAPDSLPLLAELGMSGRVLAGDVGRASAIKMVRSVMIKGLEALSLECLLAARKAGVEDEVIASLDASFPGWDWATRAGYSFERATTHGLRRAAEMREAAKTLTDLGLNNGMSRATVTWQQEMGDLALTLDGDFATRADAILAALEGNT